MPTFSGTCRRRPASWTRDSRPSSSATPVIKGTKASVPATEKWTYRYLSTTEAGKQLGDSQSIDYASTYHLIKNQDGNWQVDSVEATKTSGK